MPIRITHTEPGIYCTHWEGAVTYEDMIKIQETCGQLALENNDSGYVLIFDMTNLPHLPFTPRQTGKLISPDERVLRTIIVGASKSVQLISATVNAIFKQMHPIEHFDKMDQALQFARVLLNDSRAGTA